MSKSLPYHPFLIESLRKNPELAAAYITATLEEEKPEPQLLKRAINDVLEALGEEKMTDEEAKIHLEKLDKILSQQGSDAIYNLGNWLKALGLKLTVTVKEQERELTTNDSSKSEITVDKFIIKM
jgi:DNA-binding phage protein